MSLLVPAGDPLTTLGRKLTPADLARRDLIGKDCGTASQRALAAALSDYGLGPPRIRAHDLREVQALVRRRSRHRRRAESAARRAGRDDRQASRSHHFIPDRRIALTTRSNGARTPAVEFAAGIIRAYADE